MTAATIKEAFASAETIDIWPTPDLTLIDNGRRPAVQMPGELFGPAWSVIKQVAEGEKYDLIVQEAVYRSPRIDITEKVLKALASDK